MKLKRCPKCKAIINVDNFEDVSPDTVIGCGSKKYKFVHCSDCGHENNPDACERLRNEDGLTQTLVSDMS